MSTSSPASLAHDAFSCSGQSQCVRARAHLMSFLEGSLKTPSRQSDTCSHHVANISKQKATSRTYPRSLKNACSERSLQRSMALLYARHPSASTERCILSRKRSESSFVLAASARCLLLTIPSLSRGQHSKEFYSHPHSNVNPHPASNSQQERKEDILSSRG